MTEILLNRIDRSFRASRLFRDTGVADVFDEVHGKKSDKLNEFETFFFRNGRNFQRRAARNSTDARNADSTVIDYLVEAGTLVRQSRVLK